MTKKDEKDADRPHYYSQFWLDVAAGRRVIGTPRTEEGSDQTEAEMPEPVSAARKAAGRVASVDGYQETRSPGAAEPAIEEEYSEPEPEEEVELASDLNDEDIPNIVVEDFPEEDLISLEPAVIDEEEETEEPDEDDEFFDEEEEDDDEWAARGRKKPKPGRQVKQPKPPVKKPKRGGRGF